VVLLAVLEENIKIFFNETNKKYSFNNLKKALKIVGEKDSDLLNAAIRKLELQGFLYCDEDNRYSLFPQNADLVQGRMYISKKGNGFVDTIDGYRIYIPSEHLNNSITDDTVIITNTTYDDFNRITGTVKKIVDRKDINIVCEYRNVGGKNILVPCDGTKPCNLDINKTKLLKLVEGDRVLINLFYNSEKHDYKSDFVKIIGHRDDPDIDIKTIAYSHNIEIDFSEAVLNELKDIPHYVLEEEKIGRVDLRDENIFTIDGEDTKDIDDAISITKLTNGNYKLGVHIADVSHYVKEGSALYEAAYSRGTSVYLINSVIPMLPHQLSNGICSLNPGEDRLTLSCEMEIDNSGKIVNYDIFNSIINSKKKMTYSEVNEILYNKNIPEGYEPYINDLRMMDKLSSFLSNLKKQRGFINFNSSEIKINVDNDGNPINFESRLHDKAEMLIENFMLAANESVANYVYWMDLPFIYRIHEKPDPIKISELIEFISQLGFKLKKNDNLTPKYIQGLLEQLSDTTQFPILSDMILRSMKKARYEPESKGHFGLALDFYTHFTSPIRRLPDLAVHNLVKKYRHLQMNNKELKYLTDSLKELCNHASYKERESQAAETEAEMYKMAEYMSNHIGEYFLGNISRITQYGLMARTKEGITGKIDFEDIIGDFFVYDSKNIRMVGKKTHQTICIGDFVSLKVLTASKEDLTINFGIEKKMEMENQLKKISKTKIMKKNKNH
jgi:ribonuclease R